MRKILMILVLGMLLNSPVMGFEDDFQNHPLDVVSDTWQSITLNNDNSGLATDELGLCSGSTSGSNTIINSPGAYTQSKSVSMSVLVGSDTSCGYQQLKMLSGYSSLYWSFVLRSFSKSGDGSFGVMMYNSTGILLGRYRIDNINSSSDGFNELVVSSGQLGLYVNGVFKGNLGAISENPTYFSLYVRARNPGPGSVSSTLIIDDISTGGILGVNNQYTELDTEIQASYTTYAKYSHPSSTYKIELLDMTYGNAANGTDPITAYSGFVSYNIYNSFGNDYGLKKLVLYRDGVEESSHTFLYSDSHELSTLSFDKQTYNKSDSGTATYTIGNYNSNNYYLIRFSRQNGVEEYNTVVHNEGTKVFDMNNFVADDYNVYLIKWVESTNTYTTIAFTTLTITDTIVHTNYFYFAGGINSAEHENTFKQGNILYIKGDNSTYVNGYYYYYRVEHESVTSANVYVDDTPFSSWEMLELDEDLGQYNYSLYAYDITNLTEILIDTESMVVIPYNKLIYPVPTSPPQPTIIPTTTGQTSLIDIGTMFSEVTFGKLDSNGNNEVSETEIQTMGNKILPTLIFIVAVILVMGAFGNKKR